jgi:hypothetical protein
MPHPLPYFKVNIYPFPLLHFENCWSSIFNVSFHNGLVWVYGVYRHFQQYFSYIVTVGFYEKHRPAASHRQTLSHNFIHLALAGFDLPTSVVIDTDCIGSCKSNYHTITATHLSSVQNKKTTTCDVGNLDPGLGQAPTCGGVKPVNEIPIFRFWKLGVRRQDRYK